MFSLRAKYIKTKPWKSKRFYQNDIVNSFGVSLYLCATACVSSNYHHGWMRNCIGCKYEAFPWCASFCLMAPAVIDVKSHWLHRFGFSPLCVIMCVFRLFARLEE